MRLYGALAMVVGGIGSQRKGKNEKKFAQLFIAGLAIAFLGMIVGVTSEDESEKIK